MFIFNVFLKSNIAFNCTEVSLSLQQPGAVLEAQG